MAIKLASGLLALFLAACATTPPPELAERVTAQADADGVQRAVIVGGTYYFRPERVVVRANMPVELVVGKMRGLVPHTFVIHAPEAGIDAHVMLSSALTTVRFTPTRPGEYPFYCDRGGLFGSHLERGMTGILEVID